MAEKEVKMTEARITPEMIEDMRAKCGLSCALRTQYTMNLLPGWQY